jgi:ribulose 1,5-bisphosphate carboxylase large subunit-like protein
MNAEQGNRRMKDRIHAVYEIAPQVESPDRAFDLLLHEMTSGIQYYSTRTGAVMDRVRDHVPYVDGSVCGEVVSVKQGEGGAYMVTFSLPAANVDPRVGGITNLWPIVAGEVFNFYFIKRARLVDLDLPTSFTERYYGPGFGIQGIREKVGVQGFPLFGAIIKPNVGLDPKRAAAVAASLAEAGFDFVKDDEICVNPTLCPLRERVSRIAEALDAAAGRSGRKTLYMANVTTDFASFHEAASAARECGAGGFMLDPFCTGMSAVDYLRRNFPLPLYCHRVGYGLHCSGPSFSVSYELFSRLFRLLGADFSHVGGIWGGGADAKTKTGRYLEILRRRVPGPLDRKETWPVVSGISLENMEEYYRFYGDDTLFLEHIDIYGDTSAARRKLEALKSRVETARAGASK